MNNLKKLTALLLSVLLLEAASLLLISFNDLWARGVLAMLITIGAGCVLLAGGGLYILRKKVVAFAL